MISHLLTTKNTKESKKHCRKSHFTKERPVLSKITKSIVTAFDFCQKNRRKITTHFFSMFSSERLRSLVSLYHLRIFVFSAISLLISSTLFTTTKYTTLNEKAVPLREFASNCAACTQQRRAESPHKRISCNSNFGMMLPEFALLHFSNDGLKAQKVYSPEQRSGYKLTNYLAL